MCLLSGLRNNDRPIVSNTFSSQILVSINNSLLKGTNLLGELADSRVQAEKVELDIGTSFFTVKKGGLSI